jgi:methionyl aminopeptidase
MSIKIKSEKEIGLMRDSCRLAAEILARAVEIVKPGISTDDIDKFVHEYTVKNGAYPSPLNYHGFPKSVCTSVNNVVCHGIPSKQILKEGDIINVDVTCTLSGYHGDTSKTVFVGKASPKAQKLVDITYRCLEEGVAVAFAGNYFGDIGNAIQDLADEYGYGVVREFCGHGIGRSFHEDPMVLHYRSGSRGQRITEGMIFTIEPMLNEGSSDVFVAEDGWTVFTKDGKLSAQFEHTIAMTKNGPEVLTKFL